MPILDRNEMVLNVLNLYDELDKLSKKDFIVENCKEESNPVFEMLASIGIKTMSTDLISSWNFENYAPKVADDAGILKSYDEWKAQIQPSCFCSDDLIKYVAYNKVTFEDILRVLDSDLKKFYEKKKGEFLNENV